MIMMICMLIDIYLLKLVIYINRLSHSLYITNNLENIDIGHIYIDILIYLYWSIDLLILILREFGIERKWNIIGAQLEGSEEAPAEP